MERNMETKRNINYPNVRKSPTTFFPLHTEEGAWQGHEWLIHSTLAMTLHIVWKSEHNKNDDYVGKNIYIWTFRNSCENLSYSWANFPCPFFMSILCFFLLQIRFTVDKGKATGWGGWECGKCVYHRLIRKTMHTTLFDDSRKFPLFYADVAAPKHSIWTQIFSDQAQWSFFFFFSAIQTISLTMIVFGVCVRLGGGCGSSTSVTVGEVGVHWIIFHWRRAQHTAWKWEKLGISKKNMKND